MNNGSITTISFVLSLVGGLPASAASIWCGPTLTFEKVDGADPTDQANQDRITDLVWLARGSFQPLFNAAVETASVENSPADTEWAFEGINGNPVDPALITASNFANLTFSSFATSLGGTIGNAIVNRPGVLHLITDDIYIDIIFTSWTSGMTGSGGGFRYERSAEPTSPGQPGDYNDDGIVSAIDYTVWRDNLGAPEGTLPNDVDGGTIGLRQYQTWNSCFGTSPPAEGTLHIHDTQVPEPPSALLSLMMLVITSPRAVCQHFYCLLRVQSPPLP